MLTPRYITRTIAAGGYATIQAYGRYITIVSISASTIALAIDDDPPQQIINGLQIEVPVSYTRISLSNIGAAPATVVLYTSDLPIVDTRQQASTTAMAASLAAIDADMELIKPGTVPTLIALQAVPIAPAAALQLVTGGTGVMQTVLQCPLANPDPVYVGFANTVDDTDAFAELDPGSSTAVPHDVDIWVRCAVGAGACNVRGYAIS